MSDYGRELSRSGQRGSIPLPTFMKNMDDKEIIQLYEELTNNLIAVIQCLDGDAPCVKMIQEAMEIKARIDGAK